MTDSEVAAFRSSKQIVTLFQTTHRRSIWFREDGGTDTSDAAQVQKNSRYWKKLAIQVSVSGTREKTQLSKFSSTHTKDKAKSK